MQTDVMLTATRLCVREPCRGRRVRELAWLVSTSVTVTAGQSGESAMRCRDTTGQTRHYDFVKSCDSVKAVSTDGLTGIAPIRLAREGYRLGSGKKCRR